MQKLDQKSSKAIKDLELNRIKKNLYREEFEEEEKQQTRFSQDSLQQRASQGHFYGRS